MRRTYVIQETEEGATVSVHYGKDILHIMQGKNLLMFNGKEEEYNPEILKRVYQGVTTMTDALTKVELDLVGMDLL